MLCLYWGNGRNVREIDVPEITLPQLVRDNVPVVTCATCKRSNICPEVDEMEGVTTTGQEICLSANPELAPEPEY